MYPCNVQYFSKEYGVCQGLLDFYNDAREKSQDIFGQIEEILTRHSLEFGAVSAYSADNASVNYGRTNSVYQKMKARNSRIIAANCKCHILHNTVKRAHPCLSFDVEGLVLKVYSEFSSSASRNETLKEFFEFVDIKSYFLSMGEEDCPRVIRQFVFHDDCDDANSESLPECYLYFLHNVLQEFDKGIKRLEANDCTSVEVFDVMQSVLQSVRMRRADQFFGSRVGQILRTMDSVSQSKFVPKRINFFRSWRVTYAQILIFRIQIFFQNFVS